MSGHHTHPRRSVFATSPPPHIPPATTTPRRADPRRPCHQRHPAPSATTSTTCRRKRTDARRHDTTVHIRKPRSNPQKPRYKCDAVITSVTISSKSDNLRHTLTLNADHTAIAQPPELSVTEQVGPQSQNIANLCKFM